jgi:nicotinate-nucleotide adenylyltransferase
MTRRLGLLGGTFDPVHSGHLDAADAARSALALDDVLFVPSHDPPHRPIDPHASAFHRFAMVALALDGRQGFGVSDAELLRKGSSYTWDTLRALHEAGWQPSQLFFIVGADAFAEIATWHKFPAVLDATHFVVIARQSTTIEQALARTPDLRHRARRAVGHVETDGPTAVFLVDAHTRDITSTTIRARVAARQPIDELVSPAVARHIAANHLYATELDNDLHGNDENNAGA